MDLFVPLLQAIAINLVVSIDNSILLALVTRHLEKDRARAQWVGATLTTAIRGLLIWFAMDLFQWPWVRLVGALALMAIGVKLMVSKDETEGSADGKSFWTVIGALLIGDLAMSIDNVVAVAAAVSSLRDSVSLSPALMLALVMAICIPFMVLGSAAMAAVLNRFPWVLVLGGLLMGWIAGELLLQEPALTRMSALLQSYHPKFLPCLGVLLVGSIAYAPSWRAHKKNRVA